MPNWFINLSSPLLGIPLPTFFWATFLGLIPANYIHVSTGVTLESLSMSTSSIFAVALFAILALIPTFFKKDADEIGNKLADDLFTEEELAILHGSI